MNFTPARNDEELRALVKTDPKEVIFIRSLDDWKSSLVSPGTDEGLRHPLHSLSADEIEEFTEHLVFRNGGLAGAKIGDLGDKLSFNDYLALWRMFGLGDEMMLPENPEHQGYYCQSHGTCAPNAGYICNGNC